MTGAELITAERQREIEVEGFTLQHDMEHQDDELLHAAHCYLNAKRLRDVFSSEDEVPLRWPWEDEWWKPTPFNHIRELVKAGALIAAHIDVLLKLEEKENSKLKIQ
jgi:hypothetical protein